MKLFAAGAACALSAVLGAQVAVLPALPQAYVDTTLPASSGICTVTVPVSGDLQAAIDSSDPGATICLPAGSVFAGNFILRNKTSGSGWITIRTSTPDSLFPPPGTRVGPANANLMAAVLSSSVAPAFTTESSANHYRLIGLEIGITSTAVTLQSGYVNYVLVQFTSPAAVTDASNVPSYLVVDRCYIHGSPGQPTKRGVEANSAWTAVVDSYISEIHNIGQDTQAIAGWTGPGPFKVVNNYLEASGENILFGGAAASSPQMSPQDGEIRNNYFFKPLSWNASDPSYGGIHWSVKNLFELKNGQRFLVDGNIMENCWVDAQSGFAIFLQGIPNEDGLWVVVRDITFTNNIIRNSFSGVAFCGQCLYPPVQTTDPNAPNYADPNVQRVQSVLFQNNLFDGIANLAFAPGDNLANIGWNHNTIVNPAPVSKAVMTFDAPVSTGLVYTNNIAYFNAYGLYGNAGVPFTQYLQNYTFSNNVFIDNQGTISSAFKSLISPSNFYPDPSQSRIFVNYSSRKNGDYRLVANSPYKQAGTDGLDIGANIDELDKATSTTMFGKGSIVRSRPKAN